MRCQKRVRGLNPCQGHNIIQGEMGNWEILSHRSSTFIVLKQKKFQNNWKGPEGVENEFWPHKRGQGKLQSSSPGLKSLPCQQVLTESQSRRSKNLTQPKLSEKHDLWMIDNPGSVMCKTLIQFPQFFFQFPNFFMIIVLLKPYNYLVGKGLQT